MAGRLNGLAGAALVGATLMTPLAAPASAAGQDAGWQGRQDGRGGDGQGDQRGGGRPGDRQAQAQAQQDGRGQPGYNGPDGQRGPQGQPGGFRGDPRGQGNQYDGPYGAPNRGQYGGQYGNQYGGQYGRPDAQPGRGGPGYPGGQYANGRGGPGGGWNRGWRQDGRYDWNGYRAQNRRAFGLPRYAAPYGWRGGYRRFAVGVALDRALFGQSYWIADPFAYRLPPAYGPFRWVRYYNDALLIDLRSGQVVDGVYGIFY